MKKHAYLILAHTNFGQLRKLLELLDDERNDIFIHIDKKAGNIAQKAIEETCRHARCFVLPERISVNWGGVSIMRAELALLKAATQKGEYVRYHLLSGQDLPIKSQDFIHDFFEKHHDKEFISYWPIKPSMYSRFRYHTLFPEGEKRFRTRILNHIFKGLQMAAGYRINRDVDFRVGSQWFSITDKLARYVVDNEDWLEKVFRNTSTCDEVFLQTLVWKSPFRENLYSKELPKSQKEFTLDNMRLIDWTRGESVRHPWTFRINDLDLIKNSPHLFARKFDENTHPDIIRAIYELLNPKKKSEYSPEA